ncbi:MAG: hypothetical protein ABSE96_12200 [Terracidiphilus sp.]|jgi:hypothetical protein
MRDDRRWYENAATAEQRRSTQNTGAELERKFWVALGLYAVLAALVWFTMGDAKVLIAGKAVDLKLVPLLVLVGLALRTVVALRADKVRHQDSHPEEKGSGSTPESLS